MFFALALEVATEEWRWTEVWTPPSNLQGGLVCVTVLDMMSLWSDDKCCTEPVEGGQQGGHGVRWGCHGTVDHHITWP